MRGILLGSLALAIPYVAAHPYKAQGSSSLTKRAVDLDSFRMKINSAYTETAAVDEETKSLSRRDPSPENVATNLVKKTSPGAKFRLVESYTGDNGISHFYFRQTFNDLDVAFGDFNVNIGPDGKVFSHGSSFFDKSLFPPKGKAKKDARDALKGAVKTLRLPVNADKATIKDKGDNTYTIEGTTGTVKTPEAKLVYVQNAEGKMALSWSVETDILSNWLVSYVDAENPEKVHGVVDYSADATYEVYPWGINDPTEGERTVLTDPWIKSASEFGWHSTGSASYTSTRGNNGIAQTNWENTDTYLTKPRPASPNLKFEFPYSPEDSNWKGYSNASITQLFYTANVYHDLLHVLGFNEKAGNFETNNNGAGGKGNDLVILNAQDGSGTNNANFATPPDGQSGRMRMYMWDTATPNRDCSFEAGVVIHEYTHGVSNRLTGGPANTACLNILEAGGMGEGWGDFMATAIRLKKGDTRNTDYPMGAWVNNNPKGIRLYPYSTSLTTNPHKYTDVDAITKVHGIGTVWATMLYEVMWNLIDKYGKNDADVPTFNGKVPTDGKYLAMKLVLDGMALQPCNPNFVSARNAILDADTALTGGKNKCEIWKAFAKRGLGNGAVYSSTKRTGSTALPSGC